MLKAAISVASIGTLAAMLAACGGGDPVAGNPVAGAPAGPVASPVPSSTVILSTSAVQPMNTSVTAGSITAVVGVPIVSGPSIQITVTGAKTISGAPATPIAVVQLRAASTVALTTYPGFLFMLPKGTNTSTPFSVLYLAPGATSWVPFFNAAGGVTASVPCVEFPGINDQTTYPAFSLNAGQTYTFALYSSNVT